MKDDLEWMDDARCVNALTENNGLDLFTGEPTYYRRAVRTYCIDCPVAWECFRFALNGGFWEGVYGGTSPSKRNVIALKARHDGQMAQALHTQHLTELKRKRKK